MEPIQIAATRAKVYIDTHIVTLFKLLEEPDSFIPDGCGEATFVITLPVVRELEKIKNEHFSKGQRKRAKKCLELLEQAEYPLGVALTKRSHLLFAWQEPNERQLKMSGLSQPQTPDEFFIAAVHDGIQFKSDIQNTYLMSDDFGVRMRAKHYWRDKGVQVIAPPDNRYKQESFDLPRTIHETIKILAKEIVTELRTREQQSDGES